ncbi:MAG: 16S rRNA (cytosine(967)-C(5))-methyltransferase RsmB [Rhodocyclales bacterium]|nr:16S rRNA (cytosine(967)-C(5))-methyltransferase RsmB [Rhodocyclales bacterium]
MRLAPDSLAYSLRHAGKLVEAVCEGRNLNEAYTEMQGANSGWSDSVRGAVRDLAWGTLRDYGRGDLVLGRLLHKPLPAAVHALLLVALHRLESRPEQAYVVVDQAVAAIGSFAPGLKGVSNGVLRESQRRKKELDAALAADPVTHLRHPAWWIARVRGACPQSWEAVLAAGNQHPPMSLRHNRRRIDADAAAQALSAAGIAWTPLPNGAFKLDQPLPVVRIPGFSAGWFSVQDAGAQWAAGWLDLAAGQRVLDACAAPGGKSAHILERADVDLVALELDAGRLVRVNENLERLGLSATLRTGDARTHADWWDGRSFDRILADVPCSASGVARRNPDIKWLRRHEDIARFARQQREIVESLWHTLAPGGKMLYVTCSIFEAENGAQIARLCEAHDDMERLPLDGQMEQQLVPTAEHDGFYYALLRKRP